MPTRKARVPGSTKSTSSSTGTRSSTRASRFRSHASDAGPRRAGRGSRGRRSRCFPATTTKRRVHEATDGAGVARGGDVSSRAGQSERGAVRPGWRRSVRVWASEPGGPGRRPWVAMGHRVGHGGRWLPVCDRYAHPSVGGALPARNVPVAAGRVLQWLWGSDDAPVPAARSEPAPRSQRHTHVVCGPARSARGDRGLCGRRSRGDAGRHLGWLRGGAGGRDLQLGGGPARGRVLST